MQVSLQVSIPIFIILSKESEFVKSSLLDFPSIPFHPDFSASTWMRLFPISAYKYLTYLNVSEPYSRC